MIKRLGDRVSVSAAFGEASFPSPFGGGLEYSPPARGVWNIVHTGMLLPEAHQIFICAAGCLRGVVLTAAETGLSDRFSTVAVREENILMGDTEQRIIEGVSDIIGKLDRQPPAVLLFTSCVHHFIGCDLGTVFTSLRKHFPDIDFTDCYMDPIMRKSGLNPDQKMRRQLYSLLRPVEKESNTVAIIGGDLPTDCDCLLKKTLSRNGINVVEIHDCKSYSDYLSLAKASLFITTYPAAKAAGDALEKKLGTEHIHIPFSFDYSEIEIGLLKVFGRFGIDNVDFSAMREKCDRVLSALKDIIKNTEIALDSSAFTRPLGLARLLLDRGFNVTAVYADSFSADEKKDFDHIAGHYPNVTLWPTVSPSMSKKTVAGSKNVLAIGQKAAYFQHTDRFVDIVENGGLYDFCSVIKLCSLMEEALASPKDTKKLIQIKGRGCSSCH